MSENRPRTNSPSVNQNAEWKEMLASPPHPDKSTGAAAEAERLADALSKLELAAPADAYWYMDDRKGIFDRFVDWQAARRAQEPGADSVPLFGNRAGIALAGLVVVFLTFGAVYGMRSQFDREYASVSAGTPMESVVTPEPSMDAAASEAQTGVVAQPEVSVFAEKVPDSLFGSAPTVSVTEFEDPFLGLAIPPASASTAPKPTQAPALTSEAAPLFAPQTSKQVNPVVEPKAPAAEPEKAVLIYAPPPRTPSAPTGRRSLSQPSYRPEPASRVSSRSVRRPSPRRERVAESPARAVAADREEERRIDRQAERAFRAEYRREFGRDRRRDDWRPTPTSAVDPRNPNWGWD